MDRPRILLLAKDRALSESVLRGLRILPEPGVEIDVTLGEESVREQLRRRGYHVLISGVRDLREAEDDLLEELAQVLPVVLVGGPPRGNGWNRNGVQRVPLPLSFNLLVAAVRDALGRSPHEDLVDHGPMRGTVVS